MLRGVAALMVVIFHLFPPMLRLGYSGYVPHNLVSGVDIFFVISGFVMWWSTAGKDVQSLSFIKARLYRIAPLYWLFTAVVLLILLISPSLMPQMKLEAKYAIKSFLFIPAKEPISDNWFPLLIPGWTLNYEMAFYVLFALALLSASHKVRMAALIVPIVTLVAVGVIARPTGLLGFYCESISLEFLFGVCLAVFARSFPQSRRRVWLVLPVIGFALLLMPENVLTADTPRAVVYGIPALFIATGALFGLNNPWRPLVSLGDWSYSLYLSHLLLISALGQIYRRLGASYISFPLMALVGSIAFSGLCFRYIETPMIKALNKKRRLAPQSQATSVA